MTSEGMNRSDMKLVTVVIPNWNGMKFLNTCLSALRLQDTEDFTTLVIDNASEDGSVSFMRENFPEVQVEVMPENLGFSGGVNEGIRRAKTPYVLLLNNDTEVTPGFVSGLLKAIEKDPKIFSVSAKMLKFDDRDRIDDAGDLYNLLGWGAQRGIDRNALDKKYNKACTVFSACAGAAIYRKSVFEEMGLFDLNHFAYLEDIDVGYRAMLYGYKNVYEPSAVVYHVGSGTTGSKYNDFKVRIAARNNIYLLRKNMPLPQRIANGPFLLLGRGLKALFFKKRGFSEAYKAGLKEGKEKASGLTRVPYSVQKSGRYFKIQLLLIRYTFTYFFEYLGRRIHH